MYVQRFALDTRPRCVWVHDPAERSREFLRAISPGFFEYTARTHIGRLDSDDRQLAALGLRVAYSQALEALFAFLGATVQARECVYGWLAEYRNAELVSLVRKITDGEPVLSMLKMSPVTWEGLSQTIHSPMVLSDPEKTAQVRDSFGRLWRRFAGDFLDPIALTEYNSIKHGMRVRPGGFSLIIGPEETLGVPPPPEKMRSLGGSEFGSSFFATERLGRDRLNLRTRRTARNWSPANLAAGLQLIAMSLGNIVSSLRILAGESAEEVKFTWPSDLDAFEAPWRDVAGVFHASFDLDVNIPEERLLSKDEILQVYGGEATTD